MALHTGKQDTSYPARLAAVITGVFMTEVYLQASGLGRVQLTRNIFNFTDAQDLRLRIGYEAVVDQKGNVAGVSHSCTDCGRYSPLTLWV